ncbi:MAG TPA: small basic family protein [Fimbriimonadaceae bacterium]|nr:small basic family protein [Fimbriimonadaceae bacterium]HRE93363.1 small basic family protein [Fimbriimonadaceae bacterium]HRI73640.1 small basic family protein [Fimbriimonadaceae bacterium]
MILIPIFAFLVGAAIGWTLFQGTPLSGIAGVYLGIGVLAGLDTVLGGVKSVLTDEFRTDVFVTGFLVNVLAAAGLAWFGDQIGVQLALAAVVVMGWRIFNNLGLIRRQLLSRFYEMQRRRRVEAEGS